MNRYSAIFTLVFLINLFTQKNLSLKNRNLRRYNRRSNKNKSSTSMLNNNKKLENDIILFVKKFETHTINYFYLYLNLIRNYVIQGSKEIENSDFNLSVIQNNIIINIKNLVKSMDSILYWNLKRKKQLIIYYKNISN